MSPVNSTPFNSSASEVCMCIPNTYSQYRTTTRNVANPLPWAGVRRVGPMGPGAAAWLTV